MPKTLLAVSHLRQEAESDCVPTCAQMVLAYLGLPQTRGQLALLLGTREFGTPVDNITRLEQIGLRVRVAELSVEEIIANLRDNRPVIAFVNTADLPYWTEDTDHVVVVIGFDDDAIYVNDPFFADAPQRILRSAFELSQLRFDSRCAIIEL